MRDTTNSFVLVNQHRTSFQWKQQEDEVIFTCIPQLVSKYTPSPPGFGAMAAMVINANTTAVPTHRNVVTAVPIINKRIQQKETHKTIEEMLQVGHKEKTQQE